MHLGKMPESEYLEILKAVEKLQVNTPHTKVGYKSFMLRSAQLYNEGKIEL